MLFVLASCQHSPQLHTNQEHTVADADAENIAQGQAFVTPTAFKLESKIAIQHAGKGHSGRLHWQHTTDVDQIQMLSPFGQKVAEIVSTAQQARLLDQQQRTHTAPNVELLTQQLLGWSLPLAGLPYWALALPAPDSPAQTHYAPAGHLQQLVQDGWQIDYDDYRLPTAAQYDNQTQQMFSHWMLPHSIVLQRLPSSSPDPESILKIRLKVISWQAL